MKKSKIKKCESSIKKPPAPRSPRKREKSETVEKLKEMFGVHIISNADIKNHFGTSAEKPDGESEDKKGK